MKYTAIEGYFIVILGIVFFYIRYYTYLRNLATNLSFLL